MDIPATLNGFRKVIFERKNECHPPAYAEDQDSNSGRTIVIQPKFLEN